MQQCLTSGRGTTHEKNFGAKIGSEIRFFTIFSSLVDFFFYCLGWYLRTMSSYYQKQNPSKKNWGPKFGPNGPNSVPKLDFLSFSDVWQVSFPASGIGW